MSLLQQRWFRIAGVVLGLGLLGGWLLARDTGATESAVVASVKRGEFTVDVNSSGELRARKFVEITIPANSQQAEVYQMKIASIVPEGTIVKQGDVVAEIDRSSVANKLAEVTLALQKAEAVYEQAMLDSTLNLSKAREDIRSMELGLEEKKLAQEQALYEAPTVRRQAEIDLEKAQRALAQAQADYKTKTEQARAKMREVGADRDRERNKLQVVKEVMDGFTVRAPSPGMVIYVKEWNGRKRTSGSQVSSWNPGVATLPDLSQMESITYVNEIDVRKVAVGQKAVITLDADPTRKFTGTVSGVANVGEQRPNTDAKVFEVKITVEQSDTTLRPGMTTGNQVETARVKDALFVPLEALNGADSLQFVYRQTGGGVRKQEVAIGALNEDEVVIVHGLAEGDRVLLTPPANAGSLELNRLPESERPHPVTADTARPVPAPVSAKGR